MNSCFLCTICIVILILRVVWLTSSFSSGKIVEGSFWRYSSLYTLYDMHDMYCSLKYNASLSINDFTYINLPSKNKHRWKIRLLVRWLPDNYFGLGSQGLSLKKRDFKYQKNVHQRDLSKFNPRDDWEKGFVRVMIWKTTDGTRWL